MRLLFPVFRCILATAIYAASPAHGDIHVTRKISPLGFPDMYLRYAFVILDLFFVNLLVQVAGFPIEGTSSSILRGETSSSSAFPSFPLAVASDRDHNQTFEQPSVNDWEHFRYPIAYTKLILVGRILTSNRLSPSAVHFTLDGGIAEITDYIHNRGNVRLKESENPYHYATPGCYFIISSKLASPGGQPKMTWNMVRDVLFALEQLLEQQQRFFEVSFALTDRDRQSWGHGQVIARPPQNEVTTSKRSMFEYYQE
ncbi:MAG: hypothetical protein Q9219_006449 [cf. Caloplaca sp. 3 TL-2023]